MLPANFTENLTAELNSGHYYQVSGYINNLFVYAAKAPYRDNWYCVINGDPLIKTQAEGSDFVEAMSNAFQKYEHALTILGKSPTL